MDSKNQPRRGRSVSMASGGWSSWRASQRSWLWSPFHAPIWNLFMTGFMQTVKVIQWSQKPRNLATWCWKALQPPCLRAVKLHRKRLAVRMPNQWGIFVSQCFTSDWWNAVAIRTSPEHDGLSYQQHVICFSVLYSEKTYNMHIQMSLNPVANHVLL